MSTDGPFLWYLNRSTGLVLLVLLTLSTVLGVLAMHGRAGRGLPRFVTQSLHRNLALLSVVLLAVHVISAVADTYVDIRWWQAFVPVGATYLPLWLGLGTISLDLMAVVVLTSLVRAHLSHRTWHAVHLLSWLAWGFAVVHGLGIGTDLGTDPATLLQPAHRWAALPTLACVGAVAAAGSYRLARARRPAPVPERSLP
jgi:sulfoxide reductase heme-binding subunit YedZ